MPATSHLTCHPRMRLAACRPVWSALKLTGSFPQMSWVTPAEPASAPEGAAAPLAGRQTALAKGMAQAAREGPEHAEREAKTDAAHAGGSALQLRRAPWRSQGAASHMPGLLRARPLLEPAVPRVGVLAEPQVGGSGCSGVRGAAMGASLLLTGLCRAAWTGSPGLGRGTRCAAACRRSRRCRTLRCGSCRTWPVRTAHSVSPCPRTVKVHRSGVGQTASSTAIDMQCTLPGAALLVLQDKNAVHAALVIMLWQCMAGSAAHRVSRGGQSRPLLDTPPHAGHAATLSQSAQLRTACAEDAENGLLLKMRCMLATL